MEHAGRPQPLGEGGRPGALQPTTGQEQDAHGVDGTWKQQESDRVLIISQYSLNRAVILVRTENLEASLDCRKKMKKTFTLVEPAPDDVMMQIRTVPLLKVRQIIEHHLGFRKALFFIVCSRAIAV